MSNQWDDLAMGRTAPAVDRASFDAGLRQYMLSIYNYMAGGIALTGLLAYVVGSGMFPALTQAVLFSPLRWVLILSPLAFILVMNFGFNKLSFGALQALFWTFCATMGLSMGAIFMVYTGQSIARVFFITAALFGTMSLYGYTTKRALDGVGGFMIIGLVGIIIAGLINLFMQSSAIQFAISCLAVVIFTGLTAWDTQRLKETYSVAYGQMSLGKLAIMGALSLYLNFVNLFNALLSLFGNRD